VYAGYMPGENYSQLAYLMHMSMACRERGAKFSGYDNRYVRSNMTLFCPK